MDEHAKSGKRLGLVAAALASLAAPVVIADEAAAAGSAGGVATPQTGSRNAIVLGADGKSHNQTIVLGNDGKPANNRFVIGRDGKYHDSAGSDAHPNAIGYGDRPKP